MVGWQAVAQPHCQIERLGVVHLFEGSTHVQEYTITDGGDALLSDKLLAVAKSLKGATMPNGSKHHP